MLKKLRGRFVGVVMLIVTALLIGLFTMVLQVTRVRLGQESVALMRSVAASEPYAGAPTRRPYFVLQVSMFGRVTVTDPTGFFDLTDEQSVLALLNEALNSESDTGLIREHELRFLRARTLTGQRVVFMDCSAERSTLRELGGVCAAIFGAGWLVFFALSLLFARWAVKPAARAWDEQRRFVADASHELKTPLTVITTDAELLASPDFDETERAKLSASILTMARQMRGLVEGMLELARLDEGRKSKGFETLDLSALTEEAVLGFEPLFFEKGLGLESEIEPGLSVRGVSGRLKQAADILLDNAQKYAEPGSTAALSLTRASGRQALLCVASRGEEIPKAELKRIFDRFVRLDEARSRDASYGLGLSIAKSIVTEHKGKIWAESAEGVNRFYIQLPLAN